MSGKILGCIFSFSLGLEQVIGVLGKMGFGLNEQIIKTDLNDNLLRTSCMALALGFEHFNECPGWFKKKGGTLCLCRQNRQFGDKCLVRVSSSPKDSDR